MTLSCRLILLATTLLLYSLPFILSNEVSVASKFKAPNENTSPALIEEWRQQDQRLWDYVESHVPAVLEHTGASAFDEHLKGVQAVLRGWNAPLYVTSAGLFHSVYGTEGFQGFSLPLSERSAIQDIIGIQAEKLCFIFCMVDRYSVDKTVFAWKPNDENATFVFQSRPELGRFDITLTKKEWLDFIELTLADWMEQVEGAALTASEIFWWKQGQAYAYRRLAYKKMCEILAIERAERLGKVAPRLLQEVMATESPSTRHLHQERTPPMSQAAKEALNALRASGEDIPADFSPKPITEPSGEEL